jgi:hypothetical protein
MVHFGDGWVVRIDGCGTIIFNSKSCEHRTFTGIYYIARLKNNILSVGQLDELSLAKRSTSTPSSCASRMQRGGCWH